jgi:hypothetical protein
MDEKINWDEFEYPQKCLLSDRAKDVLIKAVKSGKCDPFRICKLGQLLECPILVQSECHNNVLRVKEKGYESKT